ncbi:MAG: hypothetical protein ACI9LY_000111 [Arenicella sp.]|jgi:hypothetical protein
MTHGMSNNSLVFDNGGFDSLYDILLTYSEALCHSDFNSQEQLKLLKKADYPIIFKDYDWSLNDVEIF